MSIRRTGLVATLVLLTVPTAARTATPVHGHYPPGQTGLRGAAAAAPGWSITDFNRLFSNLDVKDAKGKVTEYAFSSGPPGTLRRAGVKKTDFKIGDTVTVTGAPAKDGTKHLGWLKMIKYSDGRVFVYRDGSE